MLRNDNFGAFCGINDGAIRDHFLIGISVCITQSPYMVRVIDENCSMINC